MKFWQAPDADCRATLARRCLQLALVLGSVALGLVLLATWDERRASAATWSDPAQDIQPGAVATDLSLLSLAGAPDDEVLTLAVELRELETARTVLIFSTDLSDAQRLNGWLWLAEKYQAAGQTQRAAQAYRLAGSGAILSGQLSDLLRARTLLTVGQQLKALHNDASAHFYFNQAALVGAYAPRLSDYHRRGLLERLIPASLQVGGSRQDWQALDQAVKNRLIQGQRQDFNFAWYAITPGQDQALIAAGDARRAAAAAWLTALSTTDLDSDKIERAHQALRQALLVEDAAVNEYLERQQNLPAQQTRLHWISFKRRVALGGVGGGLVPEWEADYQQIDQALASAWADWLAAYTAQHGARQAARQALLAAYWGMYPQAPIEALVSLAEAANISDRLPVLSVAEGQLNIIASSTLPLVGWSEQNETEK